MSDYEKILLLAPVIFRGDYRFAKWYASDVYFLDPEIEVSGRNQLVKYFSSLLRYIVVDKTVIEGLLNKENEVVVFWQSYITLKGVKSPKFSNIKYDMVTRLKLDERGLIKFRRDYFDQFTLYEKVPDFKQEAEGLLAKYLKRLDSDRLNR